MNTRCLNLAPLAAGFVPGCCAGGTTWRAPSASGTDRQCVAEPREVTAEAKAPARQEHAAMRIEKWIVVNLLAILAFVALVANSGTAWTDAEIAQLKEVPAATAVKVPRL